MARKDSIYEIRRSFHKISDSLFTSYHEASHTIYGLLRLIKISEVSIYTNAKSKRIEGLTHFLSPDLFLIKNNNLLTYWIYAEICFSYAGLSGEKILYKNLSGSNTLPAFIKGGSSNDTQSASALIKDYKLIEPGKKRLQLKRQLIKETTAELTEHWNAVEIISHNLFKRKTLSFQDLKQILTKKSFDKDHFWRNKFQEIEYLYHQNSISTDEDTLKSIIL